MVTLPKITTIRVAFMYLLTLALTAVGVKMDLDYFAMRGISIVALTLGYMIIPLFQYRGGAFKYPFFTNNLITILIMFLVLDEFLPWWQFLAFGAVASVIKHFVRLSRLPVFNPAAAGIFVAVLFGALETWWGASFAPRYLDLEVSLAIALTIPAGLYLAYKYKKWGVSLSFLTVYAIGLFLWLGEIPLYQILEGTMLFFAFIMVSEPKTSPNLLPQQLVFGTAVAAISVFAIIQGLPAPYALALLIGNLGFRLFMWWKQKQQMKKMPKPGVPVPAVQTEAVTPAEVTPSN